MGKPRSPKVSAAILWKVIIVLSGIIYGTWYHLNSAHPEYAQSFNAALTVILLFVLVELNVETLFKLHGSRDAESTKEAIDTFLGSERTFIRDVLRDTHAELTNALRFPDQKTFVVDHRLLAIASYVKFWAMLVDEQSKSVSPLTVDIIHSCEIDIWTDHPLTSRLLALQKQFREKHDSAINRILCGRGPVPTEEFIKAFDQMKEAKIDVFYYDVDSRVVPHDFTWDFLIVRGTGVAVIWASFEIGGVIRTSIYTSSGKYDNKDLEKLWQEIKAKSLPFDQVKRSVRGPAA